MAQRLPVSALADNDSDGKRGGRKHSFGASRHVQQFTRPCQIFPAPGIGDQAVVTNAVKAAGQHMQQEAAHEFASAQRYGLALGLALYAVVHRPWSSLVPSFAAERRGWHIDPDQNNS